MQCDAACCKSISRPNEMQFAFCQSECRSIGLWVSSNASPIDYNCKLNYFAVTSADWKAVERGNKGNSIEQRQLQPLFSFLHTTKPQERCSSVKLNLWMRQTTCATFWGCQCECHAIFVFTQINWLISFIFLFSIISEVTFAEHLVWHLFFRTPIDLPFAHL